MDQIKIGQFIAEMRKEKHLTQKQLADRLGVTDRAISKWENGRGLPDYAYVKTLCDILEITFDEFISGERIARDNREKQMMENTEGLYKLFNRIRKKNNSIVMVIGVLISLLLLVGVAFVIDANRMIHNRPVLFSRWGTDYTPSVNLEDEKINIAIRDYCLDQYRAWEEMKGFTDNVCFVETNTFGIDGTGQDYYAYTYVVLEEYGIQDGEAVIQTGYAIPQRFTLVRGEQGKYEVIKAEIPDDGTAYATSLKKLYPESVIKQLYEFESNGSVNKMILNLREQKDRWFNLTGNNGSQ